MMMIIHFRSNCIDYYSQPFYTEMFNCCKYFSDNSCRSSCFALFTVLHAFISNQPFHSLCPCSMYFPHPVLSLSMYLLCMCFLHISLISVPVLCSMLSTPGTWYMVHQARYWCYSAEHHRLLSAHQCTALTVPIGTLGHLSRLPE